MFDRRNHLILVSMLLVGLIFINVNGSYIFDYLDKEEEIDDDDYEDDDETNEVWSPKSYRYVNLNNDAETNKVYSPSNPSLTSLLLSDMLKSTAARDEDGGNGDDGNENRPSYYTLLNQKIKKRTGDMFTTSSRNVIDRLPLAIPVNLFPRWLLRALVRGKDDHNNRYRPRNYSSTTRSSSSSSPPVDASRLLKMNVDDTPGKRSPDCMRRCIAQGILHPVQCHSLC